MSNGVYCITVEQAENFALRAKAFIDYGNNPALNTFLTDVYHAFKRATPDEKPPEPTSEKAP